MELLDTHQHLIYRAKAGYAWTLNIPELATGDFTLDDYQSLTEGKGILGTIFMEAGVDDPDYQNEARFIGGLISDGKILGQIASCRPEEDAGFDAWLDQCKDLGVVGLRRILHVVPDDMSTTRTFRDNLRKIGAVGLPFDLCFLAQQLPIAAELVRACDDQSYVLNHCGVPDIAGGEFESWAAGVTQMASFENVVIKLSGITAYCAPNDWGADRLRPWVDHVLGAFGPKRIIWGSDWPVANQGAGLPGWIDLTHTLLAELSDDEKRLIGHANALVVYGLSDQ